MVEKFTIFPVVRDKCKFFAILFDYFPTNCTMHLHNHVVVESEVAGGIVCSGMAVERTSQATDWRLWLISVNQSSHSKMVHRNISAMVR